MGKIKAAAPVLKWVGGKRQLLKKIKEYVPEFTTYYEPFVGGGALLFDLQPQKAIVNDLNSELINVYQVIKENSEDLITELSNEKKYANNSKCFYKIRELDRKPRKFQSLTPVEKAARVIYLNKTCFNGLYRVNSLGEFNSPFGNYPKPNIVNKEVIESVSKYFNQAEITFLNGDFEETIKGIKADSFVYLDPPYEPISRTSNFTGYNENGFGREEQIRLKKMCDKLNKRQVRFLQSNSDCEFIRKLYDGYEIIPIKARRSVSCVASTRCEIGEVLIRNYTN